MNTIKKQPQFIDWLYLIFWAIIPLIYVKSIIDYTLQPRQLFASVMILLVLFTAWKKLFGNNAFTLPVSAYAGMLVVTAIASGNAINPVESYATLSRYALVLVYLLVTTNLLRNGILQWQSLVKGIVLFAAITAIFTLVEIFQAVGSGEFLTNIYAVSATFSHKNLLSSVLLFSLPFVWIARAYLPGSWRRWSLLLLFLLIAEIFILRTRGAWLSFTLASLSVLAVYFSMGREVRDSLKFPGQKVALAGGIILVLLIGFFSASGIKTSLADTSNLDKRMVFWNHSIEMLKENPALGVGAGNWKIHFPKYGLQGTDMSVKQGITHIQRPHNDYLWVLSEGGPLSLIFYLLVFIVSLLRIRKNLKEALNPKERILELALVFGLVAFMAFSFTDFPMERVSHNLLLMSLVALVYRKMPHQDKGFVGIIPKVLVLALAAVSALVSVYRWQGEKNTVQVLNGNATRNARLMVNYTPEAINPFYNMDNFANPLRYYSSVGYLVTEQLNDSWLDIRDAYALHPNNIVVLNQMGNVLKQKKQLNEALEYYDRATEISSNFEIARLNKAEIYLNKQQFSDALAELIWMDIESQNPKFVQLMAVVLPKFLEESARTGKFLDIANGIRAQNPQTPPQYIEAYRITRRNLRRQRQVVQ